MKRFTAVLFAAALSFAFLSSPSILQAGGGHGGVGSGWAGGGHGGRGGYHGGPVGGHWGGYHGGYGHYHYGWYGGYYGWGYYPYGWGYYPYYWGVTIAGWPYGYYAGWPYEGWPYYPAGVAEASPAYNESAPQQPYYWYYCQNPQGYYPYVKSCPGGWIQVEPNAAPPNQ